MDSICLDLREEVKWVDRQLLSKRMKKELFLQELLIRESYLFVIGQQDHQIKQQVAKMTQLLDFGIKKEVSDQ